ncbi:MAG TPA: hypothetical protein VF228_20065 [Iamia sp.]
MRVVVTLEEEELARIRSLVETGSAHSAWGFVQHAVSLALDDVDDWVRILGSALDATGGPLTDKERCWADGVLGTGPGAAR